MTTEAIVPNGFPFPKNSPISRFFKWWKPDYKVVAFAFAAGLAEGLSEGKVTAVGHLASSSEMAASPLLTFAVAANLFRKDFAAAPDPGKLYSNVVTAGFMGSLVGDTITLLTLKPDHYALLITMCGVTKIAAALLIGNLVNPSVPPPNLSV